VNCPNAWLFTRCELTIWRGFIGRRRRAGNAVIIGKTVRSSETHSPVLAANGFAPTAIRLARQAALRGRHVHPWMPPLTELKGPRVRHELCFLRTHRIYWPSINRLVDADCFLQPWPTYWWRPFGKSPRRAARRAVRPCIDNGILAGAPIFEQLAQVGKRPPERMAPDRSTWELPMPTGLIAVEKFKKAQTCLELSREKSAFTVGRIVKGTGGDVTRWTGFTTYAMSHGKNSKNWTFGHPPYLRGVVLLPLHKSIVSPHIMHPQIFCQRWKYFLRHRLKQKKVHRVSPRLR